MSSLEKICRRETAWACEAETGGFRKDVSTDNRVIPRAYSGFGAIGQSLPKRFVAATRASSVTVGRRGFGRMAKRLPCFLCMIQTKKRSNEQR